MNSYSIINPYTQKTIAEIQYTTELEVNQALSLVYNGRQTQSNLVPFERAQILQRLASILKRDREKFALQITLEMGKTISESLLEVDRATNTFILSAEEATRIHGEVIHSDAFAPKREKRGMTEFFPLGVVLAITPFNFPLNLSAHKIGPAFAAGNTILYKPGPQNYLSAKMLTDACYEAGMKAEWLQLINPDIPTMNEFTKDSRIHCISFTGGLVAANAISKNAGMKKLLFELGGNDPLIIMPDADIELAVKTAVNQRFGTAGQRCNACKKIFIHEKVYEYFKQSIVNETQKLIIGDPLNPETFVGPVVNNKAAEEIMRRLDEAVARGAKILLGHKRVGNVIFPTILENVDDECLLIKDETFGPVMPLIKFDHIDEVVKRLSQSNFGLQAGIFTHDLRLIKKLFKELEVGALAVNDGPGFRAEHFPFGGVKLSGLGREGVSYAIREMSTIKTLIF